MGLSDEFDLSVALKDFKRDKALTECEVRLTPVVDNPNFLGEFFIPKGLSSPRNYWILSVLSWKMGPLGYLVRIWLEFDVLPDLDLYWKTRLSLSLKDETHSLLVFYDLVHVNARTWYGTYLPIGRKIFENLRPRLVSNVVKETARKRGYDDKGSAKPQHKWLPSSDWSLTDLQNQIEQERKVNKDTLEIIKGFLE